MAMLEFSAFITVRATSERDARELARRFDGHMLYETANEAVSVSLDDGEPVVLDEDGEV